MDRIKRGSARKVVLLLILLLLGLATVGVSCGASPLADPTPAPAFEEQVMREEVVVEREVEKGASSDAEGATPPEVGDFGSLSQRMIIRTADLAIEVEDTVAAVAQIRTVAASFGGYVSNSNVRRVSDEQMRGTVTIRVPAEDFDTALERIKGLALEVGRENISGKDVTEEYTDLGARLRNLETTEVELLELLKTRERTGRTQDILEVHRELNDIRRQIEQIKGRRQFLEQMSSLATINVELVPKPEEKPIVEREWSASRTLRNASRALVTAAQLAADGVIWLGVFLLPILVTISLPFAVVFLGWRRRRKRRASEEQV